MKCPECKKETVKAFRKEKLGIVEHICTDCGLVVDELHEGCGGKVVTRIKDIKQEPPTMATEEIYCTKCKKVLSEGLAHID